MAKVIVAAFVSLDGVMQAPGGPDEDLSGGFGFGGWIVPHSSPETGRVVGELFEKPFALLLGRKTYDIFAGYWPVVGADTPIGQRFEAVEKLVATRDPDRSLAWANSRTLGPDVVAEIGRLKREEGPDLLTQGSADFLDTLFQHDLVDEISLLTFPVILGAGKRLFGGAAAPGGWRLVRSEAFATGVVLARYARAGEVETGSFQL